MSICKAFEKGRQHRQQFVSSDQLAPFPCFRLENFATKPLKRELLWISLLPCTRCGEDDFDCEVGEGCRDDSGRQLDGMEERLDKTALIIMTVDMVICARSTLTPLA